MKEEREGLLKDIAKLKTALQHLAARNQGIHPPCLTFIAAIIGQLNRMICRLYCLIAW